MTLVLFLTLVLASEPHTLVMVNGKAISCDQYERQDGQVRIQRGGEVFALPATAIDWAKTEELRVQREQRIAAQAQVEKPKAIAKPGRGPIVLTNEHLPQSSKTRVDPIRTSYRVIGNSILVQVSINGSGPFDIILDTGASLTVIHPGIIEQLRIPLESDTIPIIGVGGTAKAGVAVLREISLSNARVEDLRVAAHSLPALEMEQVIGLLGQDFLNHFVVNLNATTKTLTLTPLTDTKRHLLNRSPQELESMAEEGRQLKSDVKASLNELGKIASAIWNSGGSSGQSQRINAIIRNLNTYKSHANEMVGLISTIPRDELSDEQRTYVDRAVSCHPKFDRLMRDLMSFAQLLRRVGSKSRDGTDAAAKSEMETRFEQLRDTHREAENCGN